MKAVVERGRALAEARADAVRRTVADQYRTAFPGGEVSESGADIMVRARGAVDAVAREPDLRWAGREGR